MIATHAMHSSAGRGGCGANVDIPRRCGVTAPCRSKQKLTNVHGPASDIASYQVSVHVLKVGRGKHTPRQNAVAEAGSEQLNLTFQFIKHAYFGPVRHMTISPSRVFSCWSPCSVEETRLGQWDELGGSV